MLSKAGSAYRLLPTLPTRTELDGADPPVNLQKPNRLSLETVMGPNFDHKFMYGLQGCQRPPLPGCAAA